MLSAALVNHNELMLPINFRALAEEHGVRKGSIYYSDTFKSWVIQGHPEIDLICIDAPFVKGQTVEGLSGKASRFNGKEIKNVVIRSNMWCAVFWVADNEPEIAEGRLKLTGTVNGKVD